MLLVLPSTKDVVSAYHGDTPFSLHSAFRQWQQDFTFHAAAFVMHIEQKGFEYLGQQPRPLTSYSQHLMRHLLVCIMICIHLIAQPIVIHLLPQTKNSCAVWNKAEQVFDTGPSASIAKCGLNKSHVGFPDGS